MSDQVEHWVGFDFDWRSQPPLSSFDHDGRMRVLRERIQQAQMLDRQNCALLLQQEMLRQGSDKKVDNKTLRNLRRSIRCHAVIFPEKAFLHETKMCKPYKVWEKEWQLERRQDKEHSERSNESEALQGMASFRICARQLYLPELPKARRRFRGTSYFCMEQVSGVEVCRGERGYSLPQVSR